MTHTPGPWAWRIEDSSMASLQGPEEHWQHVLAVYPCKSCQESASSQEWKWGRCTTPTEDNARLIAAAPDLLDAIEQALDDMGGEGHSVCETVKQQMRAAIARARAE